MFYLAKPKPDPEPDKKPEAEPHDPGLPAELMELINWRRTLLLREGWPDDEALEVAALLYIDWHEADALRKGGCPFHIILELLT